MHIHILTCDPKRDLTCVPVFLRLIPDLSRDADSGQGAELRIAGLLRQVCACARVVASRARNTRVGACGAHARSCGDKPRIHVCVCVCVCVFGRGRACVCLRLQGLPVEQIKSSPKACRAFEQLLVRNAQQLRDGRPPPAGGQHTMPMSCMRACLCDDGAHTYTPKTHFPAHEPIC